MTAFSRAKYIKVYEFAKAVHAYAKDDYPELANDAKEVAELVEGATGQLETITAKDWNK